MQDLMAIATVRRLRLQQGFGLPPEHLDFTIGPISLWICQPRSDLGGLSPLQALQRPDGEQALTAILCALIRQRGQYTRSRARMARRYRSTTRTRAPARPRWRFRARVVHGSTPAARTSQQSPLRNSFLVMRRRGNAAVPGVERGIVARGSACPQMSRDPTDAEPKSVTLATALQTVESSQPPRKVCTTHERGVRDAC